MKTIFKNLLIGSKSISLVQTPIDYNKAIAEVLSISEIISKERNISKEKAIKSYFKEVFLGQILTFVLSILLVSFIVFFSMNNNSALAAVFCFLFFLLLVTPKLFGNNFSYNIH